MIRFLHQLKILRTVIKNILVDMVNHLTALKRTPENLLHNHTTPRTPSTTLNCMPTLDATTILLDVRMAIISKEPIMIVPLVFICPI